MSSASYEAAIHLPCGSSSGYPTFSTKIIHLENKEQFEKVHGLCQNPKHMVGAFKASLIPIRTDRLDTLARDVFFPTLLNFTLKNLLSESIDKTHTVGSAAIIIISTLWDFVTLPIRLITLIPRVIYNRHVKPSEHPLQIFLREKGLQIKKQEGSDSSTGYFDDPQELRVSVSKVEKKTAGIIKEGVRYHLAFFDRAFSFFPWKQVDGFTLWLGNGPGDALKLLSET